LKAGLPQLIASVKSAGLEGLVAKRRNSRYEPGQRSGAWQKMRINRGQEFVIGGYTPSDRNFDALIFGYYHEASFSMPRAHATDSRRRRASSCSKSCSRSRPRNVLSRTYPRREVAGGV
jgi:ATP-dependent DNA ligase